MPVFTVPIHESNSCHEPAGQPTGGRFCGTGTSSVTSVILKQALLDPHGDQLVYQDTETGEWVSRPEFATLRYPHADRPKFGEYTDNVPVRVGLIRPEDNLSDTGVVEPRTPTSIRSGPMVTIRSEQSASTDALTAALGPTPAALRGVTTISISPEPAMDPPGVIHTLYFGMAGYMELISAPTVHPDHLGIEKFTARTPGKGMGQQMMRAAREYAKWLGLKGVVSYPEERTASATRVWDALKRKGVTTKQGRGPRLGREPGMLEFFD